MVILLTAAVLDQTLRLEAAERGWTCHRRVHWPTENASEYRRTHRHRAAFYASRALQL